MGLSAGDLNRRVTLRRWALSYDQYNQPVYGWESVGSVAASWRRATANERLAGAQISAQVTDIFEVRYTARTKVIDPTWSLLFSGKAYDISEVTEIGFHEGLLIRAAARADDADENHSEG